MVHRTLGRYQYKCGVLAIMKILQIIPYFVPAWDYGGPLAVCYELSKELVNIGHEVSVYTTDALDSNNRVDKKCEVFDGISVTRFRNISNYLAYQHNIHLSASMPLRIRGAISKFDIVHIHEYRSAQTVTASFFARKYRIPYIIQAHGALPVDSPKRQLKTAFDYLCGYRIINSAAKLIALNQTEVYQYKRMGAINEAIEIVPNGINLSEFEILPRKGSFRTRYGINERDFIILYLGRIHPSKGVDLLITSFAMLTRYFHNLKLVIAGPDDGQLSELKELVNRLDMVDRVVFTGPLYGSEKLKAYVDSTVFVTTSFSGFPVTFLEACACGVPIVTTDKGDNLEWINNRVGIVARYDKNSLAQAINDLLSNPIRVAKLQRNAKELVKTRFNWEIIGKQVERMYQRLIVEAQH